jgi:hypothetical protein
VESKRERDDSEGQMELRMGKLHLVDLAGSETLLGRNVSKEAVAETKRINTSLFALGDVLHALAHNAAVAAKQERLMKASVDSTDSSSVSVMSSTTVGGGRALSSSAMLHVPYLNSKLTHLLKDSLGGNSNTAIIATLCPDIDNYHPTLFTLNFAEKARKVRSKSVINRFEVGDSALQDIVDENHLIRCVMLFCVHYYALMASLTVYLYSLCPLPIFALLQSL